MKRRIGLVIFALIVMWLLWVALVLVVVPPAFATSNCETFSNHSGHVPDGWTATFTENDIDYGPYEGPTYVDPETAYEGNRTWDRAVKCRTSTTTTTEPTTTTQPTEESSTTTTPPTTTLPSTTTSTTLAPTSTAPAPSSTVPTPSTTGPSNPDQVVLPFTGSSDVWLTAGLLSLLAGVAVLTSTRREDES